MINNIALGVSLLHINIEKITMASCMQTQKVSPIGFTIDPYDASNESLDFSKLNFDKVK